MLRQRCTTNLDLNDYICPDGIYPVRTIKNSEKQRQSLTSLRCEPTLNLFPHIHVKAAADQAKFWLDPLALAANYGFAAHELNEIERIVMEHQTEL